ncbi:cohesin domain-containing protein [Patescibacteria group bacterium]|nr:cohesin domain-containing protein [Patescibacteria group bacterium]
MKKIIKSAGWFLLLISFSALPLRAQSAATILVGPEDQVINPGQETRVNISIVGADQVYGFQMDFRYDANVLEFTGWQEGEFIKRETTNNPFWVSPETNEPELIKQIAVTRIAPDQPVSGAGTLLSLSFKGLVEGTSSIEIENLILPDQSGNLLPATIENEQISVANGTTGSQSATGLTDQSPAIAAETENCSKTGKITGLKSLISWILSFFSKNTSGCR